MRHDTRTALRQLREELNKQAALYNGKELVGWAMHAGVAGGLLEHYSAKLAKIMEDDERADAIEEACSFEVLEQSEDKNGNIIQTVRLKVSGRKVQRVWTLSDVQNMTYAEYQEKLYGKKP